MSLLDRVESLRADLDYHLARHNVLVSNLAQADTPAYHPVDLERKDFAGTMTVAMSATDPNHMAPAGGELGYHVIDDETTRAADGNGVDLDREAVKIASNQMRYDTLAQLASSELAGISWAVNDGRTG